MNSPSTYRNQTWDELIFEKRNKKYGAFIIRKYANERTLFGFFITIVCLTALIVLIGSWVNKKDFIQLSSVKHELIQDNLKIIYELEKKEKISSGSQKQMGSPSSGSDKQKQDKNFLIVNEPVTNKDLDTAGFGTENNNQKDKSLGGIGIGNELDTSSFVNSGTKDGNELNGIIEIPEIYPEFPGGEDKMFEFLSSNLRFPKDYSGNRTTTTVYISFVISNNGNIEDIKIERSGGFEFDNEAIKAIKKMPKWKPGKMGERTVSVRFRLPIKFTYRN